jgi:outer membrane protein TolC
MLPKHTVFALTVASLLPAAPSAPTTFNPTPPCLRSFMVRLYGSSARCDQHRPRHLRTGFDDPQLTRYVTMALDQNLDIAQASARVTQARAGLGAANAALLPSGNVGAQAARAYQSVETPLGQVLNSARGFDRYGSSYEANLTASWELDVFGGCAVAEKLRLPTTRLQKQVRPPRG